MIENLISNEEESFICYRHEINVWSDNRNYKKVMNQKKANILLMTFKRSRRNSYWVKKCWKLVFFSSRFKYSIHVLARRDFVDDMSNSSTSRNFSRKIEKFKTSRFHFNVKLFLLDDIFTQNVFIIFWVDLTSKTSSWVAKDIKWSSKDNNESSFFLSMIKIFLSV